MSAQQPGRHARAHSRAWPATRARWIDVARMCHRRGISHEDAMAIATAAGEGLDPIQAARVDVLAASVGGHGATAATLLELVACDAILDALRRCGP